MLFNIHLISKKQYSLFFGCSKCSVKIHFDIKRRTDGKIEANAEIKNRFLKVVYIRLQNYIKVITLF